MATRVSISVGVPQIAEKSAISSTSAPNSANTGKASGKKVNGNRSPTVAVVTVEINIRKMKLRRFIFDLLFLIDML